MRTNERHSDGTEILKITSGRDFTYNGRKFHVSDLPKADMKDGNKYMLDEIRLDEIRECSRTELMFNSIVWELLKFKTIKDARKWVRDWEWCTKKWDD